MTGKLTAAYWWKMPQLHIVAATYIRIYIRIEKEGEMERKKKRINRVEGVHMSECLYETSIVNLQDGGDFFLNKQIYTLILFMNFRAFSSSIFYIVFLSSLNKRMTKKKCSINVYISFLLCFRKMKYRVTAPVQKANKLWGVYTEFMLHLFYTYL